MTIDDPEVHSVDRSSPRRASFDAAIDEIVDVSIRSGDRFRALRRSRRNSSAVLGVLAGGAFAVGLIRGAGENPAWVTISGIVVAVGFGLLVAVVMHSVNASTLRRRIRRIVEEQLAGAAAVHCDVELRPDVLWIGQGDVQVAQPWGSVTHVAENAGDVEFQTRQGLVVVRSRAFPTADERTAFLGEARRLIAQHRTTTPAV